LNYKVWQGIRFFEVPKSQRFAHRPLLRTALLSGIFKDRGQRDQAIREAPSNYGYSLLEIGGNLGMHHTTVSKIVKQAES
jgi:hypothetical protein